MSESGLEFSTMDSCDAAGANDWDTLYEEDLSLSQEQAEEIESACCARSESGSEHSSESATFTVPWFY